MKSFPLHLGGILGQKHAYRQNTQELRISHEILGFCWVSFWPRRFRMIKTMKGKIILQISVIIINYLLSFPQREAPFADWHPALVFKSSYNEHERSS